MLSLLAESCGIMRGRRGASEKCTSYCVVGVDWSRVFVSKRVRSYVVMADPYSVEWMALESRKSL